MRRRCHRRKNKNKWWKYGNETEDGNGNSKLNMANWENNKSNKMDSINLSSYCSVFLCKHFVFIYMCVAKVRAVFDEYQWKKLAMKKVVSFRKRNFYSKVKLIDNIYSVCMKVENFQNFSLQIRLSTRRMRIFRFLDPELDSDFENGFFASYFHLSWFGTIAKLSSL